MVGVGDEKIIRPKLPGGVEKRAEVLEKMYRNILGPIDRENKEDCEIKKKELEGGGLCEKVIIQYKEFDVPFGSKSGERITFEPVLTDDGVTWVLINNTNYPLYGYGTNPVIQPKQELPLSEREDTEFYIPDLNSETPKMLLKIITYTQGSYIVCGIKRSS